MSIARKFCNDWVIGALCTIPLGFSATILLTLLAWWNGWDPFSISLGPFLQMEYQSSGSILSAAEFEGHLIYLPALGGLLYAVFRFVLRLSHLGKVIHKPF